MARFPSGKAALIMWLVATGEIDALISGRAGTDLDPTLPAVRVTLVDGNPTVTGENNHASPQLEVEAWAKSASEADKLMWTIIANLPGLARTTWTPSAGPAVYVSGVAVSLGPVEDRDDATGTYRQYLDVELDVHNP